MWKKLRILIINQLGFSQSEANGFIILILLVIALAIIPRVYFNFYRPSMHVDEDQESLAQWEKEIRSSIRKIEKKKEPTKRWKKTVKKPKSFPFDPNTVTSQQLEKLGFKPYIAERIIKFRNSGGSFETKNDLFMIYGIDSVRLSGLLPYITLPDSIEKEKYDLAEEVESPEKKIVKTDINHSTEENLKKVPGIGSVFSQRIIKYRDLLGGFHRLEQLGEVYNFPDSLLPAVEKYFYSSDSTIKKISINQENLSKHPYIDYNLSRSINNYRKVHGDFQKVEDLKQIKLLNDSLFQKILPYLSK